MDLKDAVTIAGILSVGAGCWLIAPAAALIVVGGILLTLGLWPKRG